MKKVLFTLVFAVFALGSYAETAHIIFQADGIIVNQQDFVVGNNFTFPEIDQNLGEFYECYFVGWSRTSSGKAEIVTELDKVTRSETLYACWTVGYTNWIRHYEQIMDENEITPTTPFAIVAESEPYAMRHYTGYYNTEGWRYYSGTQGDFSVSANRGSLFYYDATTGYLTNNGNQMFYDFGSNPNVHYIGYPKNASEKEHEIYGERVWSIDIDDKGLASLTGNGNLYVNYFPQKYIPDGMTDMDIYFAMTTTPSHVRLFKEIKEVSDDNVFVYSSESNTVTVNYSEIDVYPHPEKSQPWVAASSGKDDKDGKGGSGSSFRVLKGYPLILSANINKEIPEDLEIPEGVEISSYYLYKPVWTSSDGVYKDYVSSSIKLNPTGNMTVDLGIVYRPASVTIGDEVISCLSLAYSNADGSVKFENGILTLTNAYLEGGIVADYPNINICVNGNCSVLGGIETSGSANVYGSGTLTMKGKGLHSTNEGYCNIFCSVDVIIVPEESSSRRRAASEGPVSAISGFEDVYFGDMVLIYPVGGHYDTDAMQFVDAEGNPAQRVRALLRTTLDISGDGLLTVDDVTLLINSILNTNDSIDDGGKK